MPKVTDSKLESGFAIYIDRVMVASQLTQREAQEHMDRLNSYDDKRLAQLRDNAKEQRAKNAAWASGERPDYKS